MDTNRIKTHLLKAISLPAESVGAVPVIEIKCDNEAYMYDFTKISEYSDSVVILKSKHYSVAVRGEKLVLSEFRSKCLKIDGNVMSVNIERSK